jgi:subtilase family serine protease
MSWGGSEFSGQGAYDGHFSAPTGPIFFASSGDAGGKVIYPSSSAYVTSVGGTSVSTSKAGTFVSESAWTSGGGGASAYTGRPTWQSAIPALSTRRGTPDLSADADPATGVAVYDSTPYKGRSGWMVFGGTSVSAPCVAGMVNASGVTPATCANTTAFLTALYNRFLATPTAFRDITSGSNGYPAVAGWDFATGVGTPQGATSF